MTKTSQIAPAAETMESQDQSQKARLQALKQDWQASAAKARPATEDQMFSELGRCLTLCAPSGMSQDERTTWLLAALAEVSAIPAEPFFAASAKARTTCDHPAKIVPAIIRASQEWADSLIRVEKTKRAQFQNANAPRLKNKPIELDPDERREVSATLGSLTAEFTKRANAERQI